MQVISEAVSLRLPEDMAKRLNKLAKTIERSKTYIIRKALQEYIDEYEDYLIAMHRLSDKENVIITQEELVSKLGSQNSLQVVGKSRS
ncbi:MAG TPA: ribbon-helix-helix domain-containing protein [Nitrososphaerales archaeon]